MGGSEVDATRTPASGKLTDGSRATSGVIVWSKHQHGPSYCAVVAIADSVHTACRGRWIATDDYEIHANPPHKERCLGCVRELLYRQLHALAHATAEVSERVAVMAKAQQAASNALIEFFIAEALSRGPVLFEGVHVEGEFE